MSGQSQRFLGFSQYSCELMCLAQGHNTVALVGIAFVCVSDSDYLVYAAELAKIAPSKKQKARSGKISFCHIF